MTPSDAIPTCQKQVHQLLESWGISVAALPFEAKHWIELSCSLSMPPDLIANFYDRHMLWMALIAGFPNLDRLANVEVTAIRAAFFSGVIPMQMAKERLRWVGLERQSSG